MNELQNYTQVYNSNLMQKQLSYNIFFIIIKLNCPILFIMTGLNMKYTESNVYESIKNWINYC